MSVKNADWIYTKNASNTITALDMLDPDGNAAGVVRSQTDPVTGGISLYGMVVVDGLVADDASAATENTAKIQDALDTGGEIFIGCVGTVYINATLLYGSNTHLKVSPATTIKQTVAKSMIKSSSSVAYLAGGTTVTLTWSADVRVSVAWTGHGKSAGEAVYIWGITPAVYIGVFKVETVVDADNITIKLPYTPSASPTGTAKAISAVQNFRLQGGTWDHGLITGNNQDLEAHAICLYIAENCHVLAGTKGQNCRKYIVVLCGTLNCSASIDIPTTINDGIKMYGPARQTYALGITGTTGDDACSIQPYEPALYRQFQLTSGGGIYDCGAKNINTTNTVGASAVTVYLSDSFYTDRIFVEDIYGASVSGAICRLDGESASSAAGTISFKNIGGQGGPSSYGFVFGTGTVKHLIIDGFKANPTATTTPQLITLQSGVTLEKLDIINPDFSSTGWQSAGGAGVIYVSGAVKQITIDGAILESVLGYTSGLLDILGNVGVVNIQNSYLPSGISAVNLFAGATAGVIINVRDNYCNGMYRIVDAYVSCVINLSGNRLNNLQQGIVRFEATATVTIKSDGTNQWSGSTVAATYSGGTATLAMYGFDIPYDVITGVASVALSASNGQFINSTRAGAVNLGPAIKNPAGWVAIGTGAAGINTVIT